MPATTDERRLALTPGAHTAPADAFRSQAAVELQFAEGEGATKTARVRILARTAEPIDHWYWGRLIHDMSGMTAKQRIPLDWCHWWDVNVGYADEIEADEESGVVLTGVIVSIRDDDQAAEILARGKAGVPYEASIDWTGAQKLEVLDSGMTAECNGRTIEGPCVIVREWTLKATAICPFGADPGTETKFSRAGGQPPPDVTVTLFSRTSAMAKQAATNDPKDTSAPAGETQLSGQQPNPPAAAQPSESDAAKLAEAAAAAFGAKLGKFVAEFGSENGSKWAAEGKSYEEALKLHATELSAQLTAQGEAKDKEIDELKAKLKAVDTGEGEAVSFSDGGDPKSSERRASQLRAGKAAAAMASLSKMPAGF